MVRALFSCPPITMRTNATYNSSDLPQCVWLHASGVPLVGIEKMNDTRREFCFERTKNIEELLMAYASGRTILCVPSRLIASYKHLKSLLFSQRWILPIQTSANFWVSCTLIRALPKTWETSNRAVTRFISFPFLIITHFTPSPENIKVLILDEELTWEEAYTGAKEPRFNRWKVLSLSELKKCLNKTH